MRRLGLRVAAAALVLWVGVAAGQDAAADLGAARAATGRRDFPAALALYERLLQQRADDADLLIEAARANGWADRHAESVRLYRRVLAVAPARRADVVPALAWQLLWSGAAAEAVPLFEQGLAASGAAAVEALDGLGQARQAMGDQAGALRAFRAAHAQAPDQLRLHRRLAMSLLWNGQEDEAVAELTRLVQREPGDRDLAWALANARNFAGLHRSALADFLRWPTPTAAGERVDVARAWRWAGYEERALPLLADAVDADGVWLRDWRLRRETGAYGYATVERADDRDRLVSRAGVVGGGWHPAPGATIDLQGRRVDLDDPFGQTQATQFQASLRWRVGEPDSPGGSLWPTLALRVNRFADWTSVTPTLRLRWVPQDRWRVDGEFTRELIEAPRAVSNRVTVDVLSAGVEQRPDARWLLAGGVAVLRFDDGTTRLRLNGRAERVLLARPRLSAGVEASALDRQHDGDGGDRGYWNPRRYREARAYLALTHEMRPWDLQARLGMGRSREVDGSGQSSSGQPHLWELGLGWDAAPALRLRLALGGSGQAMGLGGSGSGYWRRYLNLSLETWM